MFARMVARVRKAARKRILSILLSGEQLQLLKKPKKVSGCSATRYW